MKASIPQGTRDFSPLEMKRRTYMFSVLKKAFRLYGFDQIETPSFENASTLLGKYGDEGDRLIFKILNNGDFLKKADQQFLDEKNSKKLTKQICDRALRYDLTVPFARYVVQHRNDITMPFKRFQIQNVWRADRPQKGRYREFYQCDADVIGSTALQHEVELIQLYDAVFSEFNLLTVIKINNRKVLSAIAELANISDRLTEFTVILDKLDKIGKSGVVEQLNKNEFPTFAIQYIEKFLDLEGDNATMLSALSTLISDSEIGKKGLEELQEVVSQVEKFGLDSAKLQLDFTLARGLDYYTGTILEVLSLEYELGSIGGGGRYDDLTSMFGQKELSGVGISFGFDRIYLIMNELNKFPNLQEASVQLCFMNFGTEEAQKAMGYLKHLRKANISAELYPKSIKMNKQMKYANQKQIPYVALLGEDEMAENKILVKHMESGTQDLLSIEQLIEKLAN